MAEKLEEYKKKRDFSVTKEPDGAQSAAEQGKGRGKRKKELKFAVQYHIARREHYDLRLEWDGVLLSWAVPKGPSYNTADKRLAVKVEDHPIDYADFEGLIPKGQYGGGTVMLWDEGVWQPLFDVDEGLKNGALKFELKGSRLKGGWTLVRLKDKDGDDDNWLLIKEKDEFTQEKDGISKFKTGIRSGRTIRQINEEEDYTKRKNPINTANVQLARLVAEPPQGDEWLFEIKYDGYRILAFAEGGKTKLITRNGHDFTSKFKSVVQAVTELSAGRALILDGEIVITDSEGRSDFQALQNYVKKPDGKNLEYMIFDILALDGEDLRALPLIERKEKLAVIMKNPPEELRLSGYVAGKGVQSLKAAEKLGLEGIVGKRADSPYAGDRNGDWVKIKCYNRQEFVVGGYTVSDKTESGIAALVLGVYSGGKLIYAGRAGTGFNRLNSPELKKTLKKLKTSKSPFAQTPKLKNGEEVVWVKPSAVAEVQFAERTSDNLLRQASFKSLRADKDPKEVIMETAADNKKSKKTEAKPKKSQKNEDAITVCGVQISSPDKIVYKNPEISKLEVIKYYEKVSERMLAYAGGRVLSVVRCHKGISDSCFFKKHPAESAEGVEIISIKNADGESSDYFYMDDKSGLIHEAQLGSLEFHIWGSRAEALEKPDMMVFDLDPDEGMDLAGVRQGVKDLKSVLDKLKLKSFLKTSGGKGYHVVVPFKPTVGWERFHDFARGIAELMETRWPDRYTSNVRKNKRKGKIFIDWIRNGRGATSIAPYSLRARPGAKVSMPISWKELDTVAPNSIDIYEALNRLKKSDPWKNYGSTDQELKW